MLLKVAKTGKAFRLLMEDAPLWAKYEGIVVGDVTNFDDGQTRLRIERSPHDATDRFRALGSDTEQGRLFQIARQEVLDKFPSNFGLTDSELQSVGDDYFTVLIPAERNVPRINAPSAKKKPTAKAPAAPQKTPPKSLAIIKETIKTMGLESPPPGFQPAIPLREAIDTVNSYKVAEGEALELTISKRGKLKVSYEYGG